MATVFPGPDDNLSEVAATLLGLAAHQREVVFIPEDLAFEVPEYLAAQYIQGPAPVEPEQPRKRAGRRAARRTEEE